MREDKFVWCTIFHIIHAIKDLYFRNNILADLHEW